MDDETLISTQELDRVVQSAEVQQSRTPLVCSPPKRTMQTSPWPPVRDTIIPRQLLMQPRIAGHNMELNHSKNSAWGQLQITAEHSGDFVPLIRFLLIHSLKSNTVPLSPEQIFFHLSIQQNLYFLIDNLKVKYFGGFHSKEAIHCSCCQQVTFYVVAEQFSGTSIL